MIRQAIQQSIGRDRLLRRDLIGELACSKCVGFGFLNYYHYYLGEDEATFGCV